MSVEKQPPTRPVRFCGLGMMALALVCLAWRDFDSGQPAPKWLPDRAIFACAIGVLMLVAGAALEWRLWRVWGAAVITAYYLLVVVVLMNGRLLLAHYREFGAYNGLAEQLAVAAGGLMIYAANARIDPALAGRLTRGARLAFGVCAILFGGAHFAYMNLTAPLVPEWLPPSQLFWAYATGVFHIAAGAAILTGVHARLAALLLTVMFAAFTPLVHLPMLSADLSSHFIWSKDALTLLLTGAAWLVAESLPR